MSYAGFEWGKEASPKDGRETGSRIIEDAFEAKPFEVVADAERGEAAERELNAFIERRALKANAEQQQIEDLWAESARAHRERIRRANRALWYAHEMRMCELHEGLAAEHEERARSLLEEGLPAATPRTTGAGAC